MTRVWIGYDEKGKVVKVTTTYGEMSKYFATREVRRAERFDVESEAVKYDDDDLIVKGDI